MTNSAQHVSSGSAYCGRPDHINRRTLLKAAGLSGLAWLTPVSRMLARAAEEAPRGAPARSIVVLWLQGAPSQLETFDPHPGTNIAAGSNAIRTSVEGVQVGEGLVQTADLMHEIAVLRNVVSREGDHERATYNVKTGFRPDPTLVHPAIGGIVCHQLKDDLEIPRHVAITPGQWAPRGGYLGAQYDAFKVGDPAGPVPDVTARVSPERLERRLNDLENVVEAEFARGRLPRLESRRTLHLESIARARRMMSSEQLAAFDVSQSPLALREEYGDTPFGRGCLAAVRLIQAGVRCVEVTLDGWDSHVNNHELQAARVAILDPAFAALVRDLKRRDLLASTVVICGGEFGRTPSMNPAGGRDHWPHGFSIALAGGGIRGGQVVGETSPTGEKLEYERGVKVADVHATVLSALGIDFTQMLDTPVGRPMVISEGQVVKELLAEPA